MKGLFRGFIAAGMLGLVALGADAQTYWQSANGPYTGFVYAQAVDKDGNLYAGTGGHGIYVAPKLNGSTWLSKNAGLTTNAIYTIVIDNDDRIFVGTDEGVFLSTTGGDAWVKASSGLSTLFINSLAIGKDGSLFAATGGGGVLRINST